MPGVAIDGTSRASSRSSVGGRRRCGVRGAGDLRRLCSQCGTGGSPMVVFVVVQSQGAVTTDGSRPRGPTRTSGISLATMLGHGERPVGAPHGTDRPCSFARAGPTDITVHVGPQ